jgi:hypothetical protein
VTTGAKWALWCAIALWGCGGVTQTGGGAPCEDSTDCGNDERCISGSCRPVNVDPGDGGASGTGGRNGGGRKASGGSPPSAACGDGIIQATERCDKNAFGANTCASATMGASPVGTLRCSADCLVDTSACHASGFAGAPSTGGAPSSPYTCFDNQATSLPRALPIPPTYPNPGTAEPPPPVECCGDGMCVPAIAQTQFGQASCGPGEMCMPYSQPAPLPCHLKIGNLALEGACVPDCHARQDVHAGAPQAGDCQGVEPMVCQPCFDPLTGASTSTCFDVREPTAIYAECGWTPDGQSFGRCTPPEVAKSYGFDPGSFPTDNCVADDVCVPTTKLLEPRSCYSMCDSTVGPGMCMPVYLFNHRYPRLIGMFSACPGGETCMSCVDPITGAGTCDQ